MKLICMGFVDGANYQSRSREEGRRLITEYCDSDGEFHRGGYILQRESLPSAKNRVTRRIRNGPVAITDGPYDETQEPNGRVHFLVSRELIRATALMSQHPGIHIGPLEIRPADDETSKAPIALSPMARTRNPKHSSPA